LEITAWVRGRKVYDPRADTTAGGSGSQQCRIVTQSQILAKPDDAALRMKGVYNIGCSDDKNSG
jgi:hypothetical protein